MFGKERINFILDVIEYETELRILLNYLGIDTSHLEDIESLIDYFTGGNRFGKFTILNFEYLKDDDSFIFSSEDVAALSGGGSVSKYKIKGNKVERLEVISCWMS